MKPSAIAWTDYSGGIWNIVTGCTPADRSCANCYARAIYTRFGRDFGTEIWPDKLARWATAKLPTTSPKRGEGHRPMVFVVDMGDLFHETVPDKFIGDAIDAMIHRQDVTWQILTKRPERMAGFMQTWQDAYRGYGGWYEEEYGDIAFPPPNLWLGTSICDQETADERIPILLETPAAVRFVSVEPMLERIGLSYCKYHEYSPTYCTQCSGQEHLCHGWLDSIDWVICGAESGPKRRPFDAAWALDLYEQCREAQVPFFYKQGSALHPGQAAVLPGHGVVQEWPEEGER